MPLLGVDGAGEEVVDGCGRCWMMVLVMLYLYGGWAPSAGVVAVRREVRMEDCELLSIIVLENLEV